MKPLECKHPLEAMILSPSLSIIFVMDDLLT